MLGYLWDRRIENRKTIYHVKFDSIDFFTTADMLDFEADNDNISHLIKKQDVSKDMEHPHEETNEEETKSDSKNAEPNTKKKKVGIIKKAQICAN